MTVQHATGTLRRVYVRPPNPADLAAWESHGWHRPPDPAAATAEHDAFRAALAEAGVEVLVGTAPAPGDPDAIYAYDPTLPTDRGVIALRPGKEARRIEPDAVAADLAAAGLRALGAIEAPAVAEGGDMAFLDERTLVVGLGYRTNEAAVPQLRALLPDVEVHAFDLPHFRGPGECLHLLSFISLLDADLAVVYLPMMPVRLLDVLRGRGVALVEVPDEEFPTMGPNVLALGPRRALALEGNPETRRRMEAAGVEVRTYTGAEISTNGDGGPTCLTRPLERD
jgi:N-dimethylarginine dimethylaminohydrolase